MIDIITLFSSSSGNCTLISGNGTKILIDIGVSVSRVCSALSGLDFSPDLIDAIFITHEHTDHTSGLRLFMKKYRAHLYANSPTMSKILSSLDIDGEKIHTVTENEHYTVGNLTITPFHTPHDSVSSVGYIVESDGKKYGIATDTGTVTKEMLVALSGCEAVLIESNHDENMLKSGPYPYYLKKRILSDLGHLSNKKCAWLATQLAIWGTKKILLGHLSEHNNTPEIAYNEVCSLLTQNGFVPGENIVLKVASKNEMTKI